MMNAFWKGFEKRAEGEGENGGFTGVGKSNERGMGGEPQGAEGKMNTVGKPEDRPMDPDRNPKNYTPMLTDPNAPAFEEPSGSHVKY
jgi:hypothetical protein